MCGQRYQHVINMDTEGTERQWVVQSGHRLLQEEQEAAHRQGERGDRQLEPHLGDRRSSIQGSQGPNQGRAPEQSACPAAERDPAGTAKVRRRQKPVKKTRRKTAAKTTSARSVPSVLCQLMSAQAGHHQLKSVVPATGGKELEHQGDLEQGCETPHTSRLLKPNFRLAEMRPD